MCVQASGTVYTYISKPFLLQYQNELKLTHSNLEFQFFSWEGVSKEENGRREGGKERGNGWREGEGKGKGQEREWKGAEEALS